MRTNFRDAKILEHTNPNPQRVHDGFFTIDDMTVGKIVHRHILVTKPQLLELMFMVKLPYGSSRVTKLVKYGFLNRYKAYDERGKVCEHFFTLGPRAADLLQCPLPLLPDPAVATSLLAANQFIITFLANHGGFTYQLTSRAPVSGYVHVRFHVYTLMAPGTSDEAAACAEHLKKTGTDRAIFILPDRSLVPLIAESAPVLTFYAFDSDTAEMNAKLYRLDYGRLRMSNFSLGREAG